MQQEEAPVGRQHYQFVSRSCRDRKIWGEVSDFFDEQQNVVYSTGVEGKLNLQLQNFFLYVVNSKTVSSFPVHLVDSLTKVRGFDPKISKCLQGLGHQLY